MFNLSLKNELTVFIFELEGGSDNFLISKQFMNHQERKEILKSFLIFMELLH